MKNQPMVQEEGAVLRITGVSFLVLILSIAVSLFGLQLGDGTVVSPQELEVGIWAYGGGNLLVLFSNSLMVFVNQQRK
jgi:hypothetical protein